MSVERAEAVMWELLSALNTLTDEFATSQSPSWDDQGDLDDAVSQAAPAFEAMTAVLCELFKNHLQSLEGGAELDEVMSLLGRALECEPAEQGAGAASRLLYVLQRINYGAYSDPDPEGDEPDVAGDVMLLEVGLKAILAEAPEEEKEGRG